MTHIWLFGEASINTEAKPKEEFKRLYNISENCGYMVEAFKKIDGRRSAYISVLGESYADNFILESVLNFDQEKNKFTNIQKVLYKVIEGSDYLSPYSPKNQKLIQVWNYLGGEFVEIFNREKHEITLKTDIHYQQALAKEGKTDHPLYTGNGVKKRICTCIDGDKCPYHTCANCKSTDIIYGNHSHTCQKCNRSQDVTLLDPFIVCEKHGKFNRDDQECPKCTMEFNLL